LSCVGVRSRQKNRWHIADVRRQPGPRSGA
jgi:hypothetical protein